MNYEIISKIVRASGVSPGELVLIHFWGDDSHKEIANRFLEAVAALGATPLLLQQSRKINKAVFSSAQESCYCENYFKLFEAFDAVLDVFAYQPVVLGSSLPHQQADLYRRYMAGLFSVLTKARRFTQIRMPTAANAEESGLHPEEFIKRMTAAYNVDYPALAISCKDLAESYSHQNAPVLRTGKSCQLQFDLTGRSWHIDAGDGDMPCGEIYIAPLESHTQGSIHFQTLHLPDAGTFHDITLEIKDGQITNTTNEALNVFFQNLPKEERVVCELGIGMNPQIHSLCGYPVLDEKMAGTFHIAIGANTMFGGQNDAGCHRDLVGVGQLVF